MRIFTIALVLSILSIAGFASAQEEGSRGLGITLSGSTGGFALEKVETATSQALSLYLKNGRYDFGVVLDDKARKLVYRATVFSQRREYGKAQGLLGSVYFPIMKNDRIVDVGPEVIGGWIHYMVLNDAELGFALKVRVHTSTGALTFSGGGSKELPVYAQVGFEWYK